MTSAPDSRACEEEMANRLRPDMQPLFRPGYVYEIVGAVVAGQPLVLMPRFDRGWLTARAHEIQAVMALHLLGEKRHYVSDSASLEIYAVDEIVTELSDDNSVRMVGQILVFSADEEFVPDPPDTSKPVTLSAIVASYPTQLPSAMVDVGTGVWQPAGLLFYEPAPPPSSSVPAARTSIRIDHEDLRRSGKMNPVDSPVTVAESPAQSIHVNVDATASSPRPIQVTQDDTHVRGDLRITVQPSADKPMRPRHFRYLIERISPTASDPYRPRANQARRVKVKAAELASNKANSRIGDGSICPYRGHPLTQPFHRCSSCGLVICQVCYEEARGCIVIGCPESPCS